MAKIKVPLEIIEIDRNSYHIFVPCIINNSSVDILVDTGASRTVFDMEYISEQVTDPNIDEIMSSGLGPGNINTLTGLLENFSIGEYSWQKVNAVFMDLSHINDLYKRFSHKRIAGLIGGDFLFSSKARIDYGKKIINFSIPRRKKNLFG